MIEEKDITEDKILGLIDEVLNSPDKRASMKDNLKKLGVNDSASIIYNELRRLVDGRSNK